MRFRLWHLFAVVTAFAIATLLIDKAAYTTARIVFSNVETTSDIPANTSWPLDQNADYRFEFEIHQGTKYSTKGSASGKYGFNNFVCRELTPANLHELEGVEIRLRYRHRPLLWLSSTKDPFSVLASHFDAMTFPNFEEIEDEFHAACIDRLERERRLEEQIDSVDDVMARFAQHDFMEPESWDSEGSGGWIMTTESGDGFRRCFLQRQANIFDSMGDAAVQDLVKWLEHDQMEIRYIASYSLGQLTGLRPDFPHFTTFNKLKKSGRLANICAEYRARLAKRQKKLKSPTE